MPKFNVYEQDKKLSVLNLTSGKTVRHLKPEGDVGEPFKVNSILPVLGIPNL